MYSISAPIIAESPPGETAPESPIPDHAQVAAAALTKLEEIALVVDKHSRMCRDAWVAYGAALNAQRQAMTSDRAFHQWVRAHQLNTGRARFSSVRSDAMWLARNREALKDFKPEIHHPVSLRQAARDGGLACASDEPKDAKVVVLRRPEGAPAEQKPEAPAAKLFEVAESEDEFADVPPELREQFRAAKEAERRARQREEEAERERDNFRRKRKGVRGLSEWMTHQEYQLICHCLDPGAEERTPEALAEALEIFSRIEVLL